MRLSSLFFSLRTPGALAALAVCAISAYFSPRASAATFGTVVIPAGGASYSDIVLDEARGKLYLVNTTTSRIEIYSTRQKLYLSPVILDNEPLSAAMSPDGNLLYVAAYADAVLDVVDLNQGVVSARVPLPITPEGVAVGGDGRVLITGPAVGGSSANSILIYDPSQPAGSSLLGIALAPPAPTPPALSTTAPGREFLFNRSRLTATPDGKLIIGANSATAATNVVFVYETASGTVLRSRSVANLSSTLAVSPDGSKFMAGSTLFDTQTLQVLAQENAANAPFAFPAGTAGNFNLQQNQGGSVFAPDGSAIYAAFNMAPVGSATGAHTVELLVNDPDNLLIKLGLQVPENLVGKMVIESSGANIYALSDSGFTILPMGTLTNSPLAQPATQSVLLINDQCGVNAASNTAAVPMLNVGKGRFSASLQAYSSTTTTTGLGGGGGPGGGVVITLPGGGGVVIAPGTGGGGINTGGTGATTTATTANGPIASVTPSATAATLNFRFNPSATASPGTTGPSDFLVQSPEAVNIPGNIHVFQNNRSSEASGLIVPISLNASAGEGLTDLQLDTTRQRAYITNSGLNRVEVFDLRTKQLLNPIKVGQLPHGMAMSPDGVHLYVANTGGESVSIIDLDQGKQVDRVIFPALPFNASVTLSTPQTIAASGRGPQFVMSNGSLWKIDGNQAIPRTLNPLVFGTGATTVAGGTPAFWSMTATPGGEYIMLLSGSGSAYLYDYLLDDYTLTKKILTTPLTGYTGTVTAGPQGRYYTVGGTILNSSLVPVAGTGSNGASVSGRQAAAVAAISATSVAVFTPPNRTSATATVADAGQIEFYNPASGAPSSVSVATLEGPPSVLTSATGRVSTFPRTMAIDPSGSNAYLLTASGLSVVPLVTTPVSAASRPSINPGGIVSLADYTPALAPGGLFTIFGKNLGTSATADLSAPLPSSLGGACVTLNNQPLPLTMSSAGQINGQIPVTLAAGRYPLVIHSLTASAASTSTTVTISKYAPAILVGAGGQAAVVDAEGNPVTKDNPAQRDHRYTIYATGLGVTHGAPVVTGQAVPASPAAATDAVSVTIGWAPMIVNSSRLTPGLIGVYQISITVPGNHERGDALPVTLKIGGVSSSVKGPAVPLLSVD